MRFGIECQEGILLDINLTHKELADMVGTCRQTMTTVLNQLRKENHINLLNRKIVIPSMNRLEFLIEQAATSYSDRNHV